MTSHKQYYANNQLNDYWPDSGQINLLRSFSQSQSGWRIFKQLGHQLITEIINLDFNWHLNGFLIKIKDLWELVTLIINIYNFTKTFCIKRTNKNIYKFGIQEIMYGNIYIQAQEMYTIYRNKMKITSNKF